MGRHPVNDLKVLCSELVGRRYSTDEKIWKISTVLIRHDGTFLFLRRDEDKRIIMREVLLDRTRIIIGGLDEKGSCPKTGTEEIGGEAPMCKGPVDGDMEARQCGPVATEGTSCSRDVGTRAGKGER
ncbi:hypothetical protein [Sphaerochaeta sp. PS]|uniref:hypothetical protein n=1 Tax=Sphaerochaeta sp. PS TaxID=3076336 RepID=UPI0028A47746|nr:hypothetical protein [Sphaerochaeta sp. PS]MDT4761832.1 hypothetical protein [Sphaerochaeta sp. PS]